MNSFPEGTTRPEPTPAHTHWGRLFLYSAVGLVFALGMVHRLAYLGSYPWPHATDDEYHYLWEGMSLLQGEAPKSWSFLKVPETASLGLYPMSGQKYPIVQPAFDHPPLYSYLAGATAELAGATPVKVELIIPYKPSGSTTLWNVSFGRLRLLPVALFAISFWILWFLGRMILGSAGALAALVIFSSLEVFTLHQRLSVSDALLAPITMGVILTLELWRNRRICPNVTGLIVTMGIALAVFTKIIGLSLAAAVIAWGYARFRFDRKVWHTWAWAATGAAVGLLMVAGFAALWDLEVFWQTTMAQANRFTNLDGVLNLVSQQWLLTVEHSDVWMISGWIFCFLAMVGGATRCRGTFTALFGYTLAYGFFAVDHSYGWHLLPFYGFLALGWGWAIDKVWRAPSSSASFVVLLLLLCCAGTTWLADYPATRTWGRYIYAVLGILILLPWTADLRPMRIWVSRTILLLLLLTGLAGQMERHIRQEIAYSRAMVDTPIR